MSIRKLITTAALVAAGVVLSALPAKALVYSSGDVFLGVRATGGDGSSYVYLVNLGSDTQFNGVGATFAGTSIGADLAALYGDGWNARTDLYFGVFGARGTTGANSTLYASREAVSASQPSEAWAVLGSSTERGNTLSSINSARNAWVTNGPSGPTNPTYVPVNLQGGIQSSTYDSGYYSQVNSDPNFGTSSQWSNIEISFANEKAGGVLDLFRVTGNQATTQQLGYFTISDSGTLSYTAVPEPSTYALIAIAGTIMLVVYRRRQVRA